MGESLINVRTLFSGIKDLEPVRMILPQVQIQEQRCYRSVELIQSFPFTARHLGLCECIKYGH